MRLPKVFGLGIILCLAACSLYAPTYFGTKYAPTNTVESYYSTKDISRPYEVIGHMTAVTGASEYSQSQTRNEVIKKAKEIGADAVVFSEIDHRVNEHTTDDFSIKVQVLKFK